ncbi:MAG: histidinol-phosphatase [Desulfobacterales bacterium]|jgi:histidinol-phosphatase (PHP family)|nr:histidinol-phosphatase [Desulfobacterales bacterium]
MRLVSVHGGHSAEFCAHAQDSLEDILQAYIKKGFSWVGITEHMPPPKNHFRYPEEVRIGLTADNLYRRFACYIRKGNALKEKYRSVIQMAVGFETEIYSGALPFAQHLIKMFQPDYVVGSLHHVDDYMFDYDEAHYRRAAAAAGDMNSLYLRYFDLQYKMLTTLRPAVVGHFDLIRIFDPDYKTRLDQSAIREKILRNLAFIRSAGLRLDLNMRALYKGGSEPYISSSILTEALNLGIPVIPGDDSHGIDTVGYKIKEGIELLSSMGFDTNWQLPG